MEPESEIVDVTFEISATKLAYPQDLAKEQAMSFDTLVKDILEGYLAGRRRP